MGWALNNCSQKSCSPNSNAVLIIEYSPSNNEAVQVINSLAQYIYGKNPNFKIQQATNSQNNDLITINYYNSNRKTTIYEGKDLSNKDFDSLYNKILSL